MRLGISLCFVAALVLSLPDTRAEILTGSWKIALTPDKATAEKGEKEFTDLISFVGGKFSSTALSAKGFKPAAYRGDFEEHEAEFDLEQQSESDGIAIWIGEVRNGKITGRLQWKKKDGANFFFDFAGTKANAG